MMESASSAKLLRVPVVSGLETWSCHCCTAKNTADLSKCRVCGRSESYALQGYDLPFHGKNATLYRPSQVLTVLEDIHQVDGEEWSSLHSACAHGNIEIVKQLLSYKAKIEAVTNKGQTPLHLAVYSGSIACVKELLKYNANVNAVTFHERCTPLHIACQRQAAPIVVLLVDNGAAVEPLNILRRTPLHFAAEVGRVDIGKYLMMNGADRNALDVHGWSARQIAELFNHREFQELMIREGMTEKQVIIKELPTAEWHSTLWFDVTHMHNLRKQELEDQQRQQQEDEQLVLSLQHSRKEKVKAQRRAERQVEIQAYNDMKNQVKEIANSYARKMSVNREHSEHFYELVEDGEVGGGANPSSRSSRGRSSKPGTGASTCGASARSASVSEDGRSSRGSNLASAGMLAITNSTS